MYAARSSRPAATKISDLELCLVEVEHRDHPAGVRSLLVGLSSDTGLTGWGEAPLDWRSTEVADRRRLLLPALTSRSVFDIEELLQLDVLRDAPLACAVEMASWDLVGQSTGQPLCNLMGGTYRQRVPLAVRLPPCPLPDLQHIAREMGEHGFHSQAVTAAGVLDRDVEMIGAIVEAAGERAEVHLDAAGHYSHAQAQELCARLAGLPLPLLLDPVSSGEIADVASLARQTSIPLGLSRSIRGAADVMSVIRMEAAAHVVIDIFQVGGVAAARKCAAVAEAGGLSISLAAERAVGPAVAAMLQTTAATPALARGNHSDYDGLHDDVLADRLEIIDGMAAVPQLTGLGVRIDRAKVERYQVS